VKKDTYLKNFMYFPSTWEDFMMIEPLLLKFFLHLKKKLLRGGIHSNSHCWGKGLSNQIMSQGRGCN
jgi:hypothetical protein